MKIYMHLFTNNHFIKYTGKIIDRGLPFTIASLCKCDFESNGFLTIREGKTDD
jgi:hypothetical protein